MAFPPRFLDELRGRIALSELIGRRVRLERRGREYAGLCPFHHEKTPSFRVYDDHFHCFGCGAHGDAIGFVMRAERLDFIEAVEKLAGEAGLPMPRPSAEERESAQREKTLLEAAEAACAYHEVLLWGPSGRAAREYLKGRGIDAETIRNFRLGWASSDRTALPRALSSDFPEALLIESGLVRRSEEGRALAYFRDRILFPIADRRGRVIAFGGRVIGGGEPKYLNSPESPAFQKGRVLYGWGQAAAAARAMGERPRLVVVEGYMDVLALHRAGFRTAVAPLGTALGEEQLALLWRLSPEPFLSFDGDRAGQAAAARALRRALPLLRPGQSLNFALLPAGEDPDSLIRSRGLSAFEEVLAAARPLDQALWQHELSLGSTKHASGEANLRKRLDDNCKEITDRTVQRAYRRYFRIQLDKIFPWRSPQQKRGTGRHQPGGVHDGPPPPPPEHRLQREIVLATLIEYPLQIAQFSEEVAALSLPEPELDRLRNYILESARSHAYSDAEALRAHLRESGFSETVSSLQCRPEIQMQLRARRLSDPEQIGAGIRRGVEFLRRQGELTAARAALASAPTSEYLPRLERAIELGLKQEEPTDAGLGDGAPAPLRRGAG